MSGVLLNVMPKFEVRFPGPDDKIEVDSYGDVNEVLAFKAAVSLLNAVALRSSLGFDECIKQAAEAAQKLKPE